jgi:predicted acylesterase/phospholipase RssA
MKRTAFLAAGAASVASPLLDARASAASSPVDVRDFARVEGALVLSGGGARGAYEAGVIAAMVEAAGVSDGTPIPGVEAVCGASIGSLNAWFVATGQYTALSRLWATVADEDIFRLKHRFRKIAVPSSGVGTRLYEALALERGLATNVQGVLEGGAVANWIARHVDPRAKVLVPLALTVTNLRRQAGVIYYRLPFSTTDEARATGLAALRSTVGLDIDVREATDDVLREAIRASAAIPVMFDPVILPGPDGPEPCIDGGIADNTPVDVARAISTQIRAVLVDPARAPDQSYPSAVSIALEAFGIAQRRVSQNALRSAVIESEAKRLLTASTPEAQAFRSSLYDVQVSFVRPAAPLPADVPDFDNQDLIDRTFALGKADGARGFRPYRLR